MSDAAATACAILTSNRVHADQAAALITVCRLGAQNTRATPRHDALFGQRPTWHPSLSLCFWKIFPTRCRFLQWSLPSWLLCVSPAVSLHAAEGRGHFLTLPLDCLWYSGSPIRCAAAQTSKPDPEWNLRTPEGAKQRCPRQPAKQS